MEWPFSSKDTLDVVAGSLGGASKWAYLKLPVVDGMISVGMGGVCAHYFSGVGDYVAGLVFAPFMEPGTSASDLHVGQYIIGMCCMFIVGFIIRVVQAKFSPDEKKNGDLK